MQCSRLNHKLGKLRSANSTTRNKTLVFNMDLLTCGSSVADMNDAKTYDETKATGTTHGLTTLQRAVKVLGSRRIDRRTTMGKALDARRAEPIADLGRKANVTLNNLL